MNDNNKMLERVLLMMKYDSSKTLKENSEIVRNEFTQQLNEAPRLKARTPKTKAPTSKVSPNKITPSGLSLSQVKSQVAIYAKTPLPNGKLPTASQQVAYGKQLASGAVKPGTVSINAPATSKVTVTPPRGPKGPRKVTPKDKSILSRFKGSVKKYPWRYALGLGLTGAGLYYFLRDNTEVSSCLLDSLSEDEMAALGGAGTSGTIKREQVGNRLADLNGGLIFSLDKTDVTTGNGKYKGTYKCDGGALKISIAGSEFTLGNAGGTDKGTKGGGGGTSGGGGGGKYKQCSETLPIAMNCKNSTIARVQGCIGVTQDGAFGPKTSAALVAKGADGSSITQATIDKVCNANAAAKIEKLTQDVDVEDMGGNTTSNNVNIKSSDSSEDGIGG
jgi:hypothetical protein